MLQIFSPRWRQFQLLNQHKSRFPRVHFIVLCFVLIILFLNLSFSAFNVPTLQGVFIIIIIQLESKIIRVNACKGLARI